MERGREGVDVPDSDNGTKYQGLMPQNIRHGRKLRRGDKRPRSARHRDSWLEGSTRRSQSGSGVNRHRGPKGPLRTEKQSHVCHKGETALLDCFVQVPRLRLLPAGELSAPGSHEQWLPKHGGLQPDVYDECLPGMPAGGSEGVRQITGNLPETGWVEGETLRRTMRVWQ